MLCPSCFQEKSNSIRCPHCGFDESCDNHPQRLPLRHVLNGTDGRQYVVGCVLGKPGGFGIAYKSLDTKNKALVVIKESLLSHPQVSRDYGDVTVHVNSGFKSKYRAWLDRFKNEAVHISHFTSPYVVRVIDLFTANNTAYYVMPLVEGHDLAAYCKERGGRLPEAEVRDLAKYLLSALQELHSKNVIHRDIKPSNILMTDGNKKPVLIDFGAARDHFDDEHSRSHMVVHSPAYAPIEQVNGRSDQGPWTDIYALCATLYYCLAGLAPSRATERATSHGHDPLVPIHKILPTVSPELAALINHGLAISPKNRIKSADEALKLLDESTTLPPPPPPPPPSPEPVSKYLYLSPAIATVLWGVMASQNFGNYITEWPGLIVLANIVGWAIWMLKNSSAQNNQQQQTTTGLGSSVINRDDNRPIGLELTLKADGHPPLVRLLRVGEKLVIGRANSADMFLNHRLLSKQHAEISLKPNGEFELIDRNSTNGTYPQERSRTDGQMVWSRTRVSTLTGRKGRFMLGASDGNGVLLECRQEVIGD